MTENEKLDLILAEMQSMKADMSDMKADMSNMKADISNMRADILNMKADISNMKADISDMKRRITNLELHIENGTDKNIQLIAENFIELTKKLNQAIPVADKNLAYEVKVNYLIEKVQTLEQEVAELKKKTA